MTSMPPAAPQRPSALDDTRQVFRRWLHLPDTGALDAVLGTVAANLIDGDPVWLLLVGPPGGGKSEILNAVAGLEQAHPAATLTEAALLSGTPKREHDAAAKGDDEPRPLVEEEPGEAFFPAEQARAEEGQDGER